MSDRAEPPPPLYPYQALKIIEMLVDVAEAADNPAAADLILREFALGVAASTPDT